MTLLEPSAGAQLEQRRRSTRSSEPVLDATWAVLDFETTGLEDDCGVVEVAVLERRQGGIATVLMSTLVRPTVEIHPDAIAVHGIMPWMVAQAEELDVPHLLLALEGRVLVCHNLPFDYQILRRAVQRDDLLDGVPPPPFHGICTQILGQIVLPGCRGRLIDLAAHLEIMYPAPHKADVDALTTLRVAERLIALGIEEGVLPTRPTLDEVWALQTAFATGAGAKAHIREAWTSLLREVPRGG